MRIDRRSGPADQAVLDGLDQRHQIGAVDERAPVLGAVEPLDQPAQKRGPRNHRWLELGGDHPERRFHSSLALTPLQTPPWARFSRSGSGKGAWSLTVA